VTEINIKQGTWENIIRLRPFAFNKVHFWQIKLREHVESTSCLQRLYNNCARIMSLKLNIISYNRYHLFLFLFLFYFFFFFFKKKKNIITTTFRTMIGSRYTERVKNVVYHMLMRSVTVSCYFFSVINNLIVKDGCTPL
jgi:predicted PurR-regulated permease PerM